MRRVISLVGATVLLTFLCGCGGSGSDRFITLIVSMTNQDTYNPVETFAVPGQSVVFRNLSPDLHSVTRDTATGPLSDIEYPGGMNDNDSYAFIVPSDAAPGSRYYFHCRFHGQAGDGQSLGAGMSGVIVVM